MARLKLNLSAGDGVGVAPGAPAGGGGSAGGIVGTPEQQDIWEYMREMPDHLVVNAVAGSGKTFTSVEGSRRLQRLQPPSRKKDIQYMAFSKPVQEEMHAKAGEWVKAKTFHSAGLAAVQARFGQGRRLEVDFSRDRTWKVMDRTPGMPKDKAIRSGVKQLVGLAKEYGAVEREELTGIISRHGLAFGEGSRGEGAEEVEEAVLYWTPKVLAQSLEVARGEAISGGDMVWLPYAHELPIHRAELLIVDEAQDLNRVQQWFAARAGERVLVIGDRNQAIFGFRGADNKSIDTLVDLLGGANEKRLSFTRRCPVKVVELARKVVPYIQPWEGAAEGKVGEVQEWRLGDLAGPGDMVLCRVNAPLIEMAYSFIEQGKPAFIRGRDIKEGIERLLREAESEAEKVASTGYGGRGGGGGPASMRDVLLAASMVTEREVERLLALPEGRGETRAAGAQDRLRCLHAAAAGCGTVRQLREKLVALFEQGERGTMFSSVHKAKGLEADRVWVLKPELMPFPKAREGWELEQEWNLWYVAVTRARRELWWVRGEGKGEGKKKERWEER